MRKLSGRQIAAARALAGVGRDDFARAAGLPGETVVALEAGGSALLTSGPEFDAIERALACYGIVAVDETEDLGAGVRLKFTRRDAVQIARLEGEGGIVGSDDAP